MNKLSVPIAANPSTSATKITLVTMYVDGDLPENQNPHPHNPEEEGEETEVVLVDLNENTVKTLDSFYEEGKSYVEGRVYSYASGFVSSLNLSNLIQKN